MADTLRKKLINLIETRLSSYSWTTFIKKDDSSLLQPEIFKGKLAFGEDDPLPVITIIPNVDESEFDKMYKVNSKEMPVVISAIINIDDQDDTFDVTEAILGEMEKALFSKGALGLNENDPEKEDDDLFPFRYVGGGVADYPGDLGSAIITVGISALVSFQTRPGDPYS